MLKINFEKLKIHYKNNSTKLNIRNNVKNILKPLCYIFLYIFILLYFMSIPKKFSNSDYLKKKPKPRKNFTDTSTLISSKKPTFINHISLSLSPSLSSFTLVYRRDLELFEILKCPRILLRAPCLAPYLHTIPFSRIHPHPRRSKPQRFERLLTLAESFPPRDEIVKSLKKPLDRSKREKRRANKESSMGEASSEDCSIRTVSFVFLFIYPTPLTTSFSTSFPRIFHWKSKRKWIDSDEFMGEEGGQSRRRGRGQIGSSKLIGSFITLFITSYAWIDNC